MKTRYGISTIEASNLLHHETRTFQIYIIKFLDCTAIIFLCISNILSTISKRKLGQVTCPIILFFGFVSRVAIWADIATQKARESSLREFKREALISTL